MNASQLPPDESATFHSVTELNWAQELQKHDRWLRTVLFARLGNRSDVEEVLQEVALATVKQASPIDDASKSAPWLYRLAVKQALLFRRKTGRRRKLTERYANIKQPAETDGGALDPLSWLLAEERRDLVRIALSQLTARDAEILLLKYTEHWRYREIAQHLNITESAVEARLHRARKRMREELASLTG